MVAPHWLTGSILAAALALPGGVLAHPGTLPASDDLRFDPSDPTTLVIVTTFGMLIAEDEGEGEVRWICPDAVGYGNSFEPDLEIAADGAMFSTSFSGLVASRDGGCSWAPVGGVVAGAHVEDIEIDATGRVWAAMASATVSNHIAVSTDGGDSFTASTPPLADVVWTEVRAAPGSADRLYATGRILPSESRLVRSTDGGATWTDLPVDSIDVGERGWVRLLAVSPTDPDLVFVRAERPTGDVVYRSADGGATWTQVLVMDDSIRALVVRRDGASVIAGTIYGGVRLSSDGGVTWTEPAQQPQMACAGERADGALFTCGSNGQPDEFMVGRSTDAITWQPVLRASAVTAPLECPSGTAQSTCAGLAWLQLCTDLGLPPCRQVDAGPMPIPRVENDEGGCGCSSSGALAAALIPLFWRRRRVR